MVDFADARLRNWPHSLRAVGGGGVMIRLYPLAFLAYAFAALWLNMVLL